MTKHERMILDLLSEDPMLSQNEIAEKLNITRSSVSVYISHLMKEGYIRGRGYVMDDQKSIYVIGTSSIDYRTTMDYDALLGMENSLSFEDNELTVSYGGCAKNIADNLIRFDRAVSCISAIGSDMVGQELINEYKRIGIGTENMLIVPGARSSTYLEIRTSNMDHMIIHSSDVKIQCQITPEFLASKRHKLRRCKAIIAEDSLSAETLQYISSNHFPAMLVTTKPKRIDRYLSVLNQYNGVVFQISTAWAILGDHNPSEDDTSVFYLTSRLRTMVNGPVLICYGKNKFSFSGKRHAIICEYSDPVPNDALYAQYRDTVAACFFHYLLEDIEEEDLLKYLGACRSIVSSSMDFVNQQLCEELVLSVVEKKTFKFKYSYMH